MIPVRVSAYEIPKVKLLLVKYCIYRMDLQIEIDRIQNIFPFSKVGYIEINSQAFKFDIQFYPLNLILNLNVYLTENNKTSEF